MTTSPRLSILLYQIFTSRNLNYAHVKYYPENSLNESFSHCSIAQLDECLNLLIEQEAYECCAAVKLVIDARLCFLADKFIEEAIAAESLSGH